MAENKYVPLPVSRELRKKLRELKGSFDVNSYEDLLWELISLYGEKR